MATRTIGGVEKVGRARAVKGSNVPPVDRTVDQPWNWPSILERCREVVEARSVIAVDGDGLVVATIGQLDLAEADRIAAHVSKAFDLLDALRHAGRVAECLCAKYQPEGQWLTAVRVAPRASGVVTVVVIGTYTLVHRGRDRLRNTFNKLLEETNRE